MNDESSPPSRDESQPVSGLEKLNKDFNRFLNVGKLDHDIVFKYREVLSRGGEEFSRVFYAYLLKAEETAEVLKNYEAKGGRIDDLVATQTGHLFDLLSADLSDGYLQKMARIGTIHAEHGIEPVWIMGGSLLYLNHLQLIIRTSSKINDAHRTPLENSLVKILFRDMGLMLEGYWKNIDLL